VLKQNKISVSKLANYLLAHKKNYYTLSDVSGIESEILRVENKIKELKNVEKTKRNTKRKSKR
jgi:hypothetical protein